MEYMKTCTKCGESKPATNEHFYIANKQKNLLRSRCKECVKKGVKSYRAKNKDKYLEQNKKYYENNKGKILERDRKYRKDNKDKISEYQKKYHNNMHIHFLL